MTLVAVWETDHRLVAIADTRIARAPGNILTEHGPKILPITIRCNQPGPGGFLEEAFRAEIGFAYSGATLPALSAHALASTFCSQLASNAGTQPPALAEIVRAFAKISLEYMREVGQLAGKEGLFNALIFGNCPQRNELFVFEVRPRILASQLDVETIEHHRPGPESPAVIGNRPDLLLSRIRADLASLRVAGSAEAIVVRDAPKRALKALIDENADENIGGAIQQAFANRNGFQAIATLMPTTPRPPSPRNAGLFLLGFDIFDVQAVGAHRVIPQGF